MKLIKDNQWIIRTSGKQVVKFGKGLGLGSQPYPFAETACPKKKACPIRIMGLFLINFKKFHCCKTRVRQRDSIVIQQFDTRIIILII